MPRAPLLVPLLLLCACAALRGAPPAAAKVSRPQVACPADIAPEPVLGLGLEGLAAGAWVEDTSPAALALHVKGEERFRSALPLAAGAHQVVGLASSFAGGVTSGVALLREQPRGACVVNSWGVYLEGKPQLRLADTWRAADGRLAVLLLSLVTPRAGGEPEQRWMALTTDGLRVWPALGDAYQQLMVPAAALRVRRGQLQLEVRQRRTSVYAFDPKTGRFVTP